MKKLILSILLGTLLWSNSFSQVPAHVLERTQWWADARFGMFIHFGAYSVPGRGEWVKSIEKMTTEEYQKYINQFYPADLDAKKWAKLAKEAGMKYAVLTAKHHDGYCLFDSKLTDYKLSNRFDNRDVVREFADAFRAEGIKVGFYYSIIDWHHKDYPNVGNHPQKDDKEYGKRKFDWDNYLKYMHGQVEELVTNYGKVDLLWFDFSFDEYEDEKWKAKELIAMVKKHQPEVIMNNRLTQNHGVSGNAREFSGYGDFETPEQGVPNKGLITKDGTPIPWETCLTLNNNWGYNSFDNEWKSSELIIHTLVNCVSKNGNLLLNVGPDPRGNIPQPSIQILTEVGEWMKLNGESIYNCGSSDINKPEWGRFTQNGNVIYAHIEQAIVGPVNIKGFAEKVDHISLLRDGAELPWEKTWWGENSNDNVFINLNKPIHHTYKMPDDIDTVYKIVLKK